MRISAERDDPGFELFFLHRESARVFLNGQEMHHCITADEKMGFILKYCLGDNNQPYPNQQQTEAAKEVCWGDVKVLVGARSET